MLKKTLDPFYSFPFCSIVSVHHRVSYIKGSLPAKVIFNPKVICHQRLPFIKDAFTQKSFSIIGRLPSKVVIHKICLHSEVIILHTLSSMKGLLSLKIFFHKGHFPSKVVFHQRVSSIIHWFILCL